MPILKSSEYKVYFKFLGEPLTGIIKEIKESQKYSTKDKIRYSIYDGKYTYPVQLENIIKKIK